MAANKIDQIRKLTYNGEDIGMGFNSETGQAVGTALEFSVSSTSESSQEGAAEVTIIESHESLMEKLHMSAQLEGRYGPVSGGVKADFAHDTSYNSHSTFVVARMIIQNTIVRGKDFKLKTDVLPLLAPGQGNTFKTAFGDSFVRGQYKGGEFYAVMRLTSLDTKEESRLAIQLHAEVQTLAAGVSFQGELDTSRTNEKFKTDFSVKFYQKAGLGAAEIGTTLSVEDIKARLRNFPDAVKNHPYPYFIEVATYDTIPIPIPSPEEEQDFQLAWADVEKRKLQYLQKRNDCVFAAENPVFFFEPPTPQALLAAAGAYLQLANAAIAHAKALSTGKINPPQLFDPSKLVPPLTEPDIVLRRRDVGLESSFADWWVTKDNPATSTNDRDLVRRISAEVYQHLKYHNIVDPGGDPQKTLRLQGEAIARVVSSFKGYRNDLTPFYDNSFEGKLWSLSALPTMLPRTITYLECLGNVIEDTKGLDQFSGLVDLDLSSNKISSIAELGALTALRILQLDGNEISDLGPLRGCTALETLNISGNNILDLTPLGSCKLLEHLTLFDRVLPTPVRVGNPITNARALADIPAMANPFTIGNVLAVRFGVLCEGQAAQWTGMATRIGNSLTFRVHLIRGSEVQDDVWSLAEIEKFEDKPPRSAQEGAFFLAFTGLSYGDAPVNGIRIYIKRESHPPNEPDLTSCYVDPRNPKQAGFDLTAYPLVGTKFRLRSIDATIVS